MGAVKFMLPNALGIYLHDSPQRALFDKDQRFFSAGCIRVEDHRRLSRWLFRGAEIAQIGISAEQRFDLPAPTPVYIVYLTARAENGAVQVQPDVYGRDSLRPSLAAQSPQGAAVPAPLPAAAAPKAPRKVTANLKPSAKLAAVIGSDLVARTEVIKKIWDYVKANNLQDAANKRAINADAKLLPVFGKPQITMFEMAGLIGKHLS